MFQSPQLAEAAIAGASGGDRCGGGHRPKSLRAWPRSRSNAKRSKGVTSNSSGQAFGSSVASSVVVSLLETGTPGPKVGCCKWFGLMCWSQRDVPRSVLCGILGA